MITESALYRLLAWFSPSFPVGAYTYSHGLEAAVEAGHVTDRESLIDWLDALIAHGAGRNDALVLAHAWRAAMANDAAALAEITDQALALSATSELRLESTQQGAAFLKAVQQAWPAPGLDATTLIQGPLPYPVAVALAAAAHGLPLQPTLHAYVHAFAANLVSAGVRLVPLGQTDGQRAMAALEGVITTSAADAAQAPLDALGSSTWLADVLSMRHETQHTRLFRS